jgi:HPt (histidine-containing phosphotransfer) domain-containing protein
VDIVPELLQGYIEDSHERLRQIKSAASENDAGKLEFEVHTLSSSAKAYGNAALFDLARQIEGLCREGASEVAIQQVSNLLEVAEESLRQLAQRAENPHIHFGDERP